MVKPICARLPNHVPVLKVLTHFITHIVCIDCWLGAFSKLAKVRFLNLSFQYNILLFYLEVLYFRETYCYFLTEGDEPKKMVKVSKALSTEFYEFFWPLSCLAQT